MKEQYPGYQRFFLACGDFSGSATTKVCVRRYSGAFQASEERSTRARGKAQNGGRAQTMVCGQALVFLRLPTSGKAFRAGH